MNQNDFDTPDLDVARQVHSYLTFQSLINERQKIFKEMPILSGRLLALRGFFPVTSNPVAFGYHLDEKPGTKLHMVAASGC